MACTSSLGTQLAQQFVLSTELEAAKHTGVAFCNSVEVRWVQQQPRRVVEVDLAVVDVDPYRVWLVVGSYQNALFHRYNM